MPSILNFEDYEVYVNGHWDCDEVPEKEKRKTGSEKSGSLKSQKDLYDSPYKRKYEQKKVQIKKLKA